MMKDGIEQVLWEHGEMGYNTLFSYVYETDEWYEIFDDILDELIEDGIVCYDKGNYFLC